MRAGSIINPWLGHIAPVRRNTRSAIRPAIIRIMRIVRSDHMQAAMSIGLLLCVLVYVFMLGAAMGRL